MWFKLNLLSSLSLDKARLGSLFYFTFIKLLYKWTSKAFWNRGLQSCQDSSFSRNWYVWPCSNAFWTIWDEISILSIRCGFLMISYNHNLIRYCLCCILPYIRIKNDELVFFDLSSLIYSLFYFYFNSSISFLFCLLFRT